VLSLFGVVHSPAAQGTFVLPWSEPSRLPLHFGIAYAAAAVTVGAARFLPGMPEEVTAVTPSQDT
jgi:hypothetical protein